ncbi:Glutamine--fructose-6-phosphate aminotransferase [isomerizing] [Frankliniella fusca]|uniref:Glutamine--fructose-6-phosphate aminotransferase [isomerizing] n=1 Tax=Frankliniella fusca TaxID=407009 RepID=A0AAE1HYE2_9NEOP|nr:Glutamine--fructose-6-phosphate aminotransferase [isomerizing] [Frankliniella fusca]
MSQLPEWLWPVEDEEAVQEAERLIEETHNTLRKMEADMQVHRALSQHLTSKTEKLKSSVNNKIQSLEKELKNFSEPKEESCDKQPKCNTPTGSEQHESIRANVPKTSDPINIIESKTHSSFTASHQPEQLNRKHKNDSKSAEQVVISAREKVQEALAMARHVSASLDQHVSTAVLASKPSSVTQVSNVGLFKVKSQADEKKTLKTKPRLQQALLPSVSIKQSLEKQSILSIQVPPGEKIVRPNVSVFNIKHEKVTTPQDSATTENISKEGEGHGSTKCAQGAFSLEKTVAQLSKHLMEVEELREINQSQVNHVLQYLLSRVSSSSQSQKGTNSKNANVETSHIDTKETPESPVASSSSGSSNKYPIAYDSLSRFLETYKKAAEHNMKARKRAAECRHRELTKQKKEIHQSQISNQNHLLIGPLRQAVKSKVSGLDSSRSEYHKQKSYSSESDGYELSKNSALESAKDISMNKVLTSVRSNSNIYSPEAEEDGAKQNSHDTSLPSHVIPSGGMIHDEYEDDWEEEEDHNGEQQSVISDLESNANIIIVENHEPLKPPSTVNSSSDQLSPKCPDSELSPSNLNMPNLLPSEKEKSPLDDDGHIKPQEAVSPENLNRLAQSSQDQNVLLNKKQEKEMDQISIRREHNILEEVLHEEGNEKNTTEMVHHEISDPNFMLNKSKILIKEMEDKQPIDETKAKLSHGGIRKKTQARLLSSCSSSSDAEVNYEPRRPPRSARRWDLKLREDLQLQSAILLNWQLDNRLNNSNRKSDSTKDQPSSLYHKDQVIIDIENRWQRTLDELDLRLKTIEENEKINRITNEIRKQVLEEQTKTCKETKTVEGRRNSLTNVDKILQTENTRVLRDQTVQTSPLKLPESQDEELARKVAVPNQGVPFVLPQTFGSFGGYLLSSHDNQDLTSELLAYGRMGILPSAISAGKKLSKSPTSSTTSSHLQQSSLAVSLSDGELQSSGSCSCSEGEFCVCGRKRCSERAPPDGSQLTVSDGENFLRDVSQGEIPPSKVKHVLQDTSFGEITRAAFGSLDLVGESIDSEDLEWDLR